jgi:hypothetical protein
MLATGLTEIVDSEYLRIVLAQMRLVLSVIGAISITSHEDPLAAIFLLSAGRETGFQVQFFL